MELLKHIGFGLVMGILVLLTGVMVALLVAGGILVSESYGVFGGVVWALALFATFIGIIERSTN